MTTHPISGPMAPPEIPRRPFRAGAHAGSLHVAVLRSVCCLPPLTALALFGAACSNITPAAPNAVAPDAAESTTNALTAALAAGVVRVEYALRHDKGERPAVGDTDAWLTRMQARPNYRRYMLSADSLVDMEHPYEAVGYLLTPTRVVAHDTIIHPRFLQKIHVAWREHRVEARIVGFARDREALFLELDKPLPGARPLSFAQAGVTPRSVVSADRINGSWTLLAHPYAPVAGLRDSGRPVFQFPSRGLVVDDNGRPMGFIFRSSDEKIDSWKGSPTTWPVLDAREEAQLRHRVEMIAEAGIVKVQLNFRSPKTAGKAARFAGGMESQTERYASGLLLAPDTVLVLADLKRDDTVRLERVLIHRDGEPPVVASFVCSLRDYTALVVRTEKPLKDSVRVAKTAPDAILHRFLMAMDLRLQGDDKVVYAGRQRINGFEEGWRSLLHPSVVNPQGNFFIFDEEALLVAFPMDHRRKPGEATRSSWQSDPLVLVSQVQPILDAPQANADPDNVPAPEKEEQRLAWMGVQSQPLGPELARFNKVAHLTSDGASGALVSYVYPESPADKAGVKPGWILLRLHVEKYPRPLEIRDSDHRSSFVFPWSQIDNVPVEAFENAPTPWESMNSGLNKLLTDIGFGAKYKADFFADGQVISKNFETAECPVHYDRAARLKTSDDFGLTVRDMTFEVRQYFHKKADEPGVVISKVEPSSKAAIAGVKYFEVITHVNDTPVFSVSDFGNAIHEQEELKLAVKRMTTGRVVRLRMK